MKWTGYEHKPPEFFDARAMKETLYKSFDSPMKTMALAMRFKEGWEQRSKRLPEHIVNWVNDYAARRKLLNEQEEDDEILAVTLEPEEGDKEAAEQVEQVESSEVATTSQLSQPDNETASESPMTPRAEDHVETNVVKEGSQKSQESLQQQFETLRIDVTPKAAENTKKSESKDEASTETVAEVAVVCVTTENSRTDRAETKELEARRETPTPPAAADDNNMQYLPGMLHSRSLRGLFPLFSSWSLVCLGSSR